MVQREEKGGGGREITRSSGWSPADHGVGKAATGACPGRCGGGARAGAAAV